MDMVQHIQQAHTLVEALPYIQRFANKTVVVKYGGHAMTDDALRHSFARDMVLLNTWVSIPLLCTAGDRRSAPRWTAWVFRRSLWRGCG
jgi:hypothetical protein